MKIINLNLSKPKISITHGDFIKLYLKVSDEAKGEVEMETSLNEFAQLLIQENYIDSPSKDIEVIPYGRKYIIMHGSDELYQIE